MFACPQIECGGVNVVYQRHGMTQASQIYSFDVTHAGKTGFDPNMVELRRVKVTELCRPLFTTTGTNYASKLPRAQTRGTNQVTIAALCIALFTLKKADLRFPTA